MADYLGMLDELMARRKALSDEVAELSTMISGLERLANKPFAVASVPSGASASSPSIRGKKLPQAIRVHMESVGSPQTTREVADAMKAGGIPSDAKSFFNQVYNVLHRGSKKDGPYLRDREKWRLTSGGAERSLVRK